MNDFLSSLQKNILESDDISKCVERYIKEVFKAATGGGAQKSSFLSEKSKG